VYNNWEKKNLNMYNHTKSFSDSILLALMWGGADWGSLLPVESTRSKNAEEVISCAWNCTFDGIAPMADAPAFSSATGMFPTRCIGRNLLNPGVP
jgi:hypothetical protein